MGYRFFLELAFTIPFILSSTLFLFLAMKGLFSIYSQPRYFKGVPVLSFRTGWLGQMVECFYLIDPTPLIQRGYDMYRNSLQPFAVPMGPWEDQVILPIYFIPFVLNAKQISVNAHFKDLFRSEYTAPPFAYGKYYHSVFTKLVGKHLTALLERPSVATMLTTEARYIISCCLGNDTNHWVEIPLMESMEKMTGFLLGLLCVGPEANRAYLSGREVARTSWMIGFVAKFIGAFPPYFRPYVGSVLSKAIRWQESFLFKRLSPFVEHQLDIATNIQNGLGRADGSEWKSGETFLDLLINAALTNTDFPEEQQVDVLIYRLFMVLFPGIRDSARSMSNIFLDMLHLESSPGELQRTLRLEISALRLLAQIESGQDVWSTKILHQALLLDSSIKESLRLNCLNSNGPLCRVVSWNGITIPGTGVHLPAGTSIGFPQFAVHRDQDYYFDALNYHAFRHTPEEYLARDKYFRGDVPEEICKRDAMTATSVDYLVFGHGRHVCPGRYIFSYIAKLLFAEILLHYDIEPVGSRPEVKRWRGSQIPDYSTKFRVKKRKDDDS